MQENDVFAGLEPAGLWTHFAAMTRIPRPSGREREMAAYVTAWAERLGYPVQADERGNLCVHVPGDPSRPDAPVVVLQSHLDMVCERDPGSAHDAERGDIHVVRDGEWLRAEGTTLGADNGIGVAAMLHAGEAADLRRGPLDLLFTVEEETGLDGAQALAPRIVRGRVLINLDNEEDGELCVGCAGSRAALVSMRGTPSPPDPGAAAIAISVGGLLGGHSGMDIVKPRLNAIRALGRLLRAAAGAGDARLVSIRGGGKRNAIPRDASAVISVPSASESAVREALAREADALRGQHAAAEPGLTIDVAPSDAQGDAWSADETRRLADLLVALPCGVRTMSPSVPGLVETSSSIGTLEMDGPEVRIGSLVRSSLAPGADDVVGTIGSVARLAGASAESTGGYPGWQPDPASRVVEVARGAFERTFGAQPRITGVHAGLECGIIGDRIPGMDMVSFGPDIRGPHAPGERVHAGSVARFWRLLAAVLDDLSRPA
jgi:dipeptidase D